jgi:hypothetical protein
MTWNGRSAIVRTSALGSTSDAVVVMVGGL